MSIEKLDKLDRIILNEGDAKKVIEWATINRGKYDETDIPMYEGLMVLNSEVSGHKISAIIHFEMSQDKMSITTYDGMDNAKLCSTTIGVDTDPKNLDIVIYDNRFEKVKDMVKKDITGQFLLLMDVFQYMNHHREYVQETKRRKTLVKKAKSGKSSSTKNRVTKINTTIYTFDYSSQGIEKRQYERHTESWTQRGFWRHYKKSGKTVWIEPQVKGSGKNIQPKTYKL